MVDFLPSRVRPFFANSKFQSTDREIVVAHIVVFLQTHNDEWDYSINPKEFFDHTKIAKMEHETYQNPLANEAVCHGFYKALRDLIDEGYLVANHDRSEFNVSGKLLTFLSEHLLEIDVMTE